LDFKSLQFFFRGLVFWQKGLLNLIILTLLILFYCLIIWKSYSFISNKDLIELNLKKYNKSNSPFLSNFLALIFYFVEYIILGSNNYLVYFVLFSFFYIFTQRWIKNWTNFNVFCSDNLLRLEYSSYFLLKILNLSKDVAKTIPFVLLTVLLLNPQSIAEKNILSSILEIPLFFSYIFVYIVFISACEIILRILDLISTFIAYRAIRKKISSIQ
jgi:hypothetical protein